MNALRAHWEKIILGVVCILFVAVLAMALLGKTSAEEFAPSKQVKELQGAAASSGIPGLAEIASEPAPEVLKPNSFTHPWLQRSTADFNLLTRLWSLVCDETGEKIMYKDDVDGDGMPNKFELKYGFDWIDPADGAMDKDGDTLTNAQEFKDETDPTDPTDPNVVDDEYRVVQIYRPKRNIKLRNVAKGSAKPLQFSVTQGKRTHTKFQKSGDTITINKDDLYTIGEFTEVKTNIYRPEIKRTVERDISQVMVTDLKTGKEFVLVRDQDSFEDYVEAKVVRKESGEELVLIEGEKLPVSRLKKDATAKKLDEKEKTGTFAVGAVEYTVKAEK
jgi:hypothetical protein